MSNLNHTTSKKYQLYRRVVSPGLSHQARHTTTYSGIPVGESFNTVEEAIENSCKLIQDVASNEYSSTLLLYPNTLPLHWARAIDKSNLWVGTPVSEGTMTFYEALWFIREIDE